MAILSKKAQNKIDEIVKRYKAFLKLKTIGPHAVTREEMIDLIRSGMLTKKVQVKAPVHEAYLHTHEQMVNDLPAPRQVRDGALDFLERMHKRYIDKIADQISADVQSTVEGTLSSMFDRRAGSQIYEVLQSDDLFRTNLRGLLRDKVNNWEWRYKTIVNTELNRAANWGAMDAILHNNPAKAPEQIVVFKQGNKPGHGTCKHCEKFWYLDDKVTPRVYKMSELIGKTNVGKKAKDWEPTIDSTHPNESHVLIELKPGFGFINGSLEYVGEDHDEFKRQRKGK